MTCVLNYFKKKTYQIAHIKERCAIILIYIRCTCMNSLLFFRRQIKSNEYECRPYEEVESDGFI